MKILQLTAENVKKLKVVDITPQGDLVQITGKNGSGKSSVLDAIWWALSGTKHITSMPIRQGEESARIRLNLGEIIVTRRFTEKGSTLTVENAEGAKYNSPQKMLDDLIGELSFDPLAFANMEAKEQYNELKRIAKISIDIEALEAQNKVDYDKRTAKNREAKELEARIGAYQFKHYEIDGPVDVSALMDQMQSASEHNSAIDARVLRRQQFAQNIDVMKSRCAAIDEQIRKLSEERTTLAAELKTAEHTLANAETLPEKIDVTQLRAQVDAANERNEEHKKRQEQAALKQKAVTLKEEADKLSEDMAARDAAKAQAIAEAQMPIAGIAISNGQVLFNSVPFDQCSSAEQLRTSVAIAMAANPKLRVIRIKDGSLLDEDGLAMIADMAKNQDYQVWIEMVRSDGKIGIVMEDGAIKAQEMAT